MSNVLPLEQIRNIGIIAHIDAGKTTVTERILYYTHRTYKVGAVDEGTAVMDWMDQERERGITICAAATTCYWQDHSVNIIDTPGHVDFTAEVERSLRVLDGGVVVLDAVAGVQPQSETVWRQANSYRVPRICFVNKMDRIGADFYRTVNMIEDILGAKTLPLQLPLGEEKSFNGIVDLIEERAVMFSETIDSSPVEMDIPQEYLAKVKENRRSLIERLAEEDDALMEAYIEGRNISTSDIRAAIRRTTLSNKLVPVLCGSALKNKGIQPLLDAIVYYLPAPSDIPPVEGIHPKTGKATTRPYSEDAPFAALAFKVVTDPFMGRLVYLRVYSGKVKVRDQVYNSVKEKKERLDKLLLMHANRREELNEAKAGSIIAAIGLKNTFTGDTLCSTSDPIVLESIQFPVPVISVAIEPKTKADQDRIGEALTKLSQEDPTFEIRYDQEMGQTIISGMGELHLEVLVGRLLSEFRVAAKTGNPQVAYKETITQPSQAEGKFIKQFGGRGQYGHVQIKIEPKNRGEGFEFVNQIRAGSIPREYIPAVEAGVKESLARGTLASYPIVDIKVTLYDGSFHEVDSSDVAFKMAASIAIKEGIRKAKPVLLEPIMKLDLTTPEQFIGDIIADINTRRAQIKSIDIQDNFRLISCLVPLGETFGYATQLRSLSQGRATYSMEFHSYEELPSSVSEQIINNVRWRV